MNFRQNQPQKSTLNQSQIPSTATNVTASDLFTDQQMIEEKKTICFVINDQEILFSKQTLINYSFYISSLVQNLDPTKNVRILLPKWMNKQAFIRFLKYVQDYEIRQDENLKKQNSKFIIKNSPNKSEKKLDAQLIHNLLQIADFFQCKIAIEYCIQNLEINKDNALVNIREALKKIQNCQQQNNLACKDCWFSLVQKSIVVAGKYFQSEADIEKLLELNNKYVTKEVLERSIRTQILNGINQSSVFERSLKILSQGRNLAEVSQEGDSVEILKYFLNENKARLQQIQEKKKSYIDWKVNLKPLQNSYKSDPVRIDELNWQFQIQIDRQSNSCNFYVVLLTQDSQEDDSKSQIDNFQRSQPQSPLSCVSWNSRISNNNRNRSNLNSHTNSSASISQQNQRSNTTNPNEGSQHKNALSFQYSMNRIAGKQRQPNQNQRQKQQSENNQTLDKILNISLNNNECQSLTNQTQRNEQLNAQQVQHIEKLQDLQGLQNFSNQSFSNSVQRIKLSSCNKITNRGFPYAALTEVQLAQSFNETKQMRLQNFNTEPNQSLIIDDLLIDQNLNEMPILNFKIIFRVDFLLTALLYQISQDFKEVIESPLIYQLTSEQIKCLLVSGSLNIESEDQIINLLINYQTKNSKEFDVDLYNFINWNIVSDQVLKDYYQNFSSLDPILVKHIKGELQNRNLIANTFEAILIEKQQEISTLKSELEKYKMGEKIAASILESPYSYGSNTQQIRRRRQGSNVNVNMTANFENPLSENLFDQTYNSNNTSFMPTGTQDNRKDERISLPKCDLNLDNFDRNSFYVSEKGCIDSYSCSPNNFEIGSQPVVQQRCQSQQMSKGDNSVKRTLAINLTQLARQIEVSEQKQQQDQQQHMIQIKQRTVKLDQLIGQSQKILEEQKSQSALRTADIPQNKAALQLKEVLNQTEESSMINLQPTAATSKMNSRSISNQVPTSSIHSKNSSYASLQLNQTKPHQNLTSNLEKLNTADISIKHQFFQKLDEQKIQKHQPNSQKNSNQDLVQMGVYFPSSTQNQNQGSGNLINQTFLQRFRLQQTDKQSTQPQQTANINLSFNTQNSQLQNNHSIPQKRQPRFIIKKQSN
eukprot:403339906